MQSITVAEHVVPAVQLPVDPKGGAPADETPLPELSFVHPMPGFAALRRFALVRLEAPQAESGAGSEVSAGESALYELRSLERPEVRFLMAVPGAYFSDYEIELEDRDCAELGLVDSADALILIMLTVGRDAANTTANLLAPIVINARTRAAAQVILAGSDWPVRAPIG
jgi:flagellar assembly factor FliW